MDDARRQDDTGKRGGGGRSARLHLGVEIVFWGLVVAALALLVAPLWLGPMPPLTDFGGHVQMADAWVRLADDPFVAGFVARQHDLWAPNLLAVRFAAWCYPLLDVVSGLRLFVSLSIVGLGAGALWVLAEFRRSRWLVFLVLPLTWNGMLALGLISYAAAMALMLVAVALARRIGERARTRDMVALAFVLATAFFAHGLGAPLAMAMAGVVLAVSARRSRALWGVASFLPAVALWLRWFLATRRTIGLGSTPSMRFTAEKSWDELLVNTVDVTQGGTGLAILAVLVGAWIALLATAEGGVVTPTWDAGGVGGWRGALRRWSGGVWGEAREHTLELLGLGLLAGYFFIAPGYIGDTFISPRLIIPGILLLFMAPRVTRGRLFPALAIAAAVGATFFFGAHLVRRVAAFEHEELGPVAALAREIPPRQRVLCAEVFRVDPLFIRSPLDHNCNGVLVAATGGFADGGFADTPYNAVELLGSAPRLRLESGKWQSYPALSRLDYVVARGDHRGPPADVAEVVDTFAPPPWELGPTWTLYRVIHPEVVPTTWEGVAGGTGGTPISWNCPRGMALSGIVATSTPDGRLVGSVQPRCRSVEVRGDGMVVWGARRELGPRFGNAAPHQRRVLECAGAQVLAGLEGGNGAFIDRVGVRCGEARRLFGEDEGVPEVVMLAPLEEEGRPQVGGTGGDPFVLECPADTLPVGLRGAFGFMVDAVGIACGPARGILEDAGYQAAAAAGRARAAVQAQAARSPAVPRLAPAPGTPEKEPSRALPAALRPLEPAAPEDEDDAMNTP